MEGGAPRVPPPLSMAGVKPTLVPPPIVSTNQVPTPFQSLKSGQSPAHTDGIPVPRIGVAPSISVPRVGVPPPIGAPPSVTPLESRQPLRGPSPISGSTPLLIPRYGPTVPQVLTIPVPRVGASESVTSTTDTGSVSQETSYQTSETSTQESSEIHDESENESSSDSESESGSDSLSGSEDKKESESEETPIDEEVIPSAQVPESLQSLRRTGSAVLDPSSDNDDSELKPPTDYTEPVTEKIVQVGQVVAQPPKSATPAKTYRADFLPPPLDSDDDFEEVLGSDEEDVIPESDADSLETTDTVSREFLQDFAFSPAPIRADHQYFRNFDVEVARRRLLAQLGIHVEGTQSFIEAEPEKKPVVVDDGPSIPFVTIPPVQLDNENVLEQYEPPEHAEYWLIDEKVEVAGSLPEKEEKAPELPSYVAKSPPVFTAFLKGITDLERERNSLDDRGNSQDRLPWQQRKLEIEQIRQNLPDALNCGEPQGAFSQYRPAALATVFKKETMRIAHRDDRVMRDRASLVPSFVSRVADTELAARLPTLGTTGAIAQFNADIVAIQAEQRNVDNVKVSTAPDRNYGAAHNSRDPGFVLNFLNRESYLNSLRAELEGTRTPATDLNQSLSPYMPRLLPGPNLPSAPLFSPLELQEIRSRQYPVFITPSDSSVPQAPPTQPNREECPIDIRDPFIFLRIRHRAGEEYDRRGISGNPTTEFAHHLERSLRARTLGTNPSTHGWHGTQGELKYTKPQVVRQDKAKITRLIQALRQSRPPSRHQLGDAPSLQYDLHIDDSALAEANNVYAFSALLGDLK